MKLLIELPEHNLNVIKRFVGGDGAEKLSPRIIEDLIRSAYLGIILDGLTNGEVIQKMFPNNRVDIVLGIVYFYIHEDEDEDFDVFITFPLDWWNRKWGE